MNKSKIAIIEDDAAISNMYRIKFETEGYEVQIAENGLIGLKMLEEFLPDIVLLDLMMPEMNGADMLVELRKKSWGQDIKVIILTNLGHQEAPDSLDNLGVCNFIVKAEMTPKQVAEIVKNELSQ